MPSKSMEAKAIFRAVDKDGDGVLTRPELQAQLSSFGLQSADVEQLFSKLDTDGDGTIDLDEWIAGYALYTELIDSGKSTAKPLLT